MKKKNLIVLLIIPFLISALTIVTVNVSYNLIDVDISHIQWDFEDIEAFQIGEDKVILSAEGVNNRNHKVGKGNELVWFVKNKISCLYFFTAATTILLPLSDPIASIAILAINNPPNK